MRPVTEKIKEQDIKDLREWGCGSEARFLMMDLPEYRQHFIEARKRIVKRYSMRRFKPVRQSLTIWRDNMTQ